MTDAMSSALSVALNGRPVSALERLSGGANMETWAFNAGSDAGPQPFILRRSPDSSVVSASQDLVSSLPIEAEAVLIEHAGAAGVPVPHIEKVLSPTDSLGVGFVMNRVPGEALPQKIFAAPDLADAREQMAFQCGEALARIHRIDPGTVPGSVPRRDYAAQMQHFQQLLDEYGNTSPVHQLALNYLKSHPPQSRPLVLVHGDFRTGNLLVDSDGLAAVLDWELAHVGHPWEDIGYFCANVWRFGHSERPAGGFGDYETLLAGYRQIAGDAPGIRDVKHWELVAALNWGLVTQTMVAMYESGVDQRLERAAVGRRLSESEVDILLLLDELERSG